MIEIDIRKQLSHFTLDTRFTVPSDGITALFGRSGAGKSTLLACVAGLMTPDAGRISVNGRVLFEAGRTDLRPEYRRIGVVFQDGRLFPHLTVRRNLLYGLPAERTAEPPLLDDVVDLLGIGALLDRRPGTLSGGERQRVAIGRALLSKPDALLMDEPLAALDGPRKAEILPMLSDLRSLRRMPILYVSHQMDEVVALADTLALVSDGRVIEHGPVEDLTSRLDLRPLTGRHEAGSVLRATVAGHDDEWGLTLLTLAGARLSVPRMPLPAGTRIRVRIRARDVGFALSPPQDSSFLNVLPAVVEEVSEADGPSLDVRLKLQDATDRTTGDRLWGRVTRKSADRLGIEPGRPIHALIKTVAVDRHSLAPLTSEPKR